MQHAHVQKCQQLCSFPRWFPSKKERRGGHPSSADLQTKDQENSTEAQQKGKGNRQHHALNIGTPQLRSTLAAAGSVLVQGNLMVTTWFTLSVLAFAASKSEASTSLSMKKALRHNRSVTDLMHILEKSSQCPVAGAASRGRSPW